MTRERSWWYSLAILAAVASVVLVMSLVLGWLTRFVVEFVAPGVHVSFANACVVYACVLGGKTIWNLATAPMQRDES